MYALIKDVCGLSGNQDVSGLIIYQYIIVVKDTITRALLGKPEDRLAMFNRVIKCGGFGISIVDDQFSTCGESYCTSLFTRQVRIGWLRLKYCDQCFNKKYGIIYDFNVTIKI